MIKLEIRNRIDFPKLTLQSDLKTIARDIIIPDIQMGIHNRMAINGEPLPENEPQTKKRKGDDRPLIETGRLISSFFYKQISGNKVLVSIKPVRKDIGGYLQIDGIRTKTARKFYKFFGISKDAHDSAIAYMVDKIKERIRARRNS
jgi:hypothetical protein